MIRLLTNLSDRIYYLFALFSFLIASYTIIIHIGFIVLPLFFIFFGFFSHFFLKDKALLLFFFLVPLINSLPAFFFNGYSFNLMGTLLFYLSGIVISHLLKTGNGNFFSGFPWGRAYLVFLSLLWISALFIFLKWSNVTLSKVALFRDTPVSPGIPLPPRNSFATIFPVITLFLFSMTPFTVKLIRESRIDKIRIFRFLGTGYIISFCIALFQKFFNPSFMAIRWWSEKLGQFNGGFSDFNGFGFFSGVILLYSSVLITEAYLPKRDKGNYFSSETLFGIFLFLISLAGIFFSGSRTAFIFLLFAFFYFFFNRRFSLKLKLFSVLTIIMIILVTGSVLEKRLGKTLSKISALSAGDNIISTLDKISNGRVRMIEDSLKIISDFPLEGVGIGNFLFYRKFMKYGEEYLEDLPLNQYLLIADETGLSGLAAFTLFLLFLIWKGAVKSPEGKTLVVIMIVMMVGNSFWLPEILILFWILVAFSPQRRPVSVKLSRYLSLFALALIVIFSLGNIVSFSKLHPKRLMTSKELPYDFGFWEESVKSDFNWTKGIAGFYLKLDSGGESQSMTVTCGAPLKELGPGTQKVLLSWRGKLFKEKLFKVNEDFRFRIRGKPFEAGFLGIRVIPTFNLKKLGLGPESRDLGVMFRIR